MSVRDDRYYPIWKHIIDKWNNRFKIKRVKYSDTLQKKYYEKYYYVVYRNGKVIGSAQTRELAESFNNNC